MRSSTLTVVEPVAFPDVAVTVAVPPTVPDAVKRPEPSMAPS